MSEEAKAEALFEEAKKKCSSKSSGFFGSLFKSGGSSSNKESAADMFVKAGNLFKISKKWKKAGDSFSNAANIYLNELSNKLDATQNFVESGNCYRKESFNEAIDSYKKAIDLYTDMGRLSMSAKHLLTVAEIYENSLKDIKNACVFYEKAADFFKGEESRSQANKCMLKIAEYSALEEDYKKAVSIYEEVAEACLDSSLLKYSVKDYMFRASLCNLCLDIVAAKRCIDNYCQQSPNFADSREANLIRSLIDAIEDDNSEKFTETLQKYDATSRLDSWFTTLFLRVKNSFNEDVDIT